MIKFDELSLEEIVLTDAEYDEFLIRERKLWGQCEYQKYCILCVVVNMIFLFVALAFRLTMQTLLICYMPIILLCISFSAFNKRPLKCYSNTVRGVYGKVVFLDNKGGVTVLTQGKEYQFNMSDNEEAKKNSIVGRNFIFVPYKYFIFKKCLVLPYEDRGVTE